jgi:CRISPR/Cas system-associated endonuclease Cas1
MREGRDGSSKFIFDLMEPERPKVDRAVLDFVKATVFDPADFIIRSDGVVRLNSQLARCVTQILASLSFTEQDRRPTVALAARRHHSEAPRSGFKMRPDSIRQARTIQLGESPVIRPKAQPSAAI